MAKIDALSSVGIFTKDQRKAKDFCVRKVGLKVRESTPKIGFLALGATKGGEDASLTVWQPDPATWGAEYEAAAKQVGTVTGVGFRTGNFEKTVAALRRRKVEVEVSEEPEGEPFARITDPDGNVLFLFEPSKTKVRRPGLAALDFVTVVTRDAARAREFFTKALGMKAKKAGMESFEYRLSPRGTSIWPFTPQRESYKDPADYEADMAHIGENTWIMFRTRDILGLQETLMGRGVRFKRKAERASWGGLEAEFFDPDDNVYWLIEPPA